MTSRLTYRALTGLTCAAFLSACAVAPTPITPDTSAPETSEKITASEAKRLACPVSVLDAGASVEDCACVESKLYDIGQKPGAIKYDTSGPQGVYGEDQGKRDIAIGILRLDAFEHCGLFDPTHIVSKNLHSARNITTR